MASLPRVSALVGFQGLEETSFACPTKIKSPTGNSLSGERYTTETCPDLPRIGPGRREVPVDCADLSRLDSSIAKSALDTAAYALGVGRGHTPPAPMPSAVDGGPEHLRVDSRSTGSGALQALACSGASLNFRHRTRMASKPAQM